MLSLKQVIPVRLLKNKFFQQISDAETRGADVNELKQLLGRGRAKKGMFEGDTEEGELEIGQVSALVDNLRPAGVIVRELWEEFKEALEYPLKSY